MKELFFFGENKERVNNKPYVVSADIRILLERWAEKKNYILPNEKYFNDMRDRFGNKMRTMFPIFDLVEEPEIVNGLTKIMCNNSLPILSLDRVYVRSDQRLDIARIVNTDGENKGYGRRADSPMLLSQFRALKQSGITQVALVDDVIFSGDMLKRVCQTLEKLGISVPNIYAGIGIGEGIRTLSENGRNVQCVKNYTEVIDEICERDFYPGVPLSGRLVNDGENIGAPYILPFGKPTDWASIPSQSQVSFSQFCLQQTIELFTAIEGMSGTIVKCSDIERKIIGMPNDATRFVDILKSFI